MHLARSPAYASSASVAVWKISRSSRTSTSNGRRRDDPGAESRRNFTGTGDWGAAALRQAFVAAALLAWWSPSAATTPRDCLRPAEARDLRLYVKGEVATIVIANVTDRCAIFFTEPPKLLGDTGETGVPGGAIVRLTARDGGQLSVTNPNEPRSDGWFPGMNADRAFDQPRVTLRAREKRAIPMNLANIMREIAKAKVAAKLPDLPWGKTISVQISLTLLTPNGEHGDGQMGVHKPFQRFKYRLPENRPD